MIHNIDNLFDEVLLLTKITEIIPIIKYIVGGLSC